jgi:arylsulfatase
VKVIFFLGIATAASFSAFAQERPNIVMMVFDDMGFSDPGCFGGDIRTPWIDRLANNGLRFSNFHNASKCEPSRASILSGLFHTKTGMSYDEGIRTGVTLGEVLKTAGYHTMAVGKWHVAGNPYDRGFDRAFGYIRGCPDYFRGDMTANNGFHRDGKPFKVPSDYYLTEMLADQAVGFLQDHFSANNRAPFFLYHAVAAPHWPLMAPEETVQSNLKTYEAGWDVIRQSRFEHLREAGLISKDWKLPPRPATVPAWESMPQKEREFEARRMAVYAAMIEEADKGLGRILELLSEKNVLENTLIIVLSDNGSDGMEARRRGEMGAPGSLWPIGVGWASVNNTPFRHYKVAQANGGTKTAMIAHWPKGIQDPGHIRSQRLHIVDLMPTFIELSGASYPQEWKGNLVPPSDGVSFAPLLKKDDPDFSRPPLYFHMLNNKAVIAGDWKLISDYGQPWALYNLKTDGTEMTDLTAQHPERARHLRELWDTHDKAFPLNDSRAWKEHERVPLEQFKTEPSAQVVPVQTLKIATQGSSVLAEWKSEGLTGGFKAHPIWECTSGADGMSAVIKLDETRAAADYSPADGFTYSHMNSKILNPGRYIQMNLTFPAGRNVRLAELTLNIYSSKTGPQQVAVRSSSDGFVSNLTEVALVRGHHTAVHVDLSPCPQATEFRIYLWDAQGLQKGWLADHGAVPAARLSGSVWQFDFMKFMLRIVALWMVCLHASGMREADVADFGAIGLTPV